MPNTTRQSPSSPPPHTSCPEDSSWPPPPQSQWRPPHSPTSTATMPPDDDRNRISPSPSSALEPPSPGTFLPITTTTNTTTNTNTSATPAPDDDPPSPSTSLSRTMSPAPQALSPSPSRETSSPSPAPVIDDTEKHGEAMDVDDGVCGQTGQPRKSFRPPCSAPGSEAQASSSAASGKGLDFREYSAREESYSATSMGSQYPSLRAITTSPSSYLRAGTKFHGTQQSERQVYDVAVEIKHVDLRDSFLCGYLRIQDLTEDHPTLTTYFEGEIIGPKYGFITNHPSWGATDKVDLSHWAKFNAFRPYVRSAKKQVVSGSGGGGVGMVRDVAQQENVFMRWKEHFLVPDHRVTTIRGASFEGFYYICFNQVKGEVSGIYFHSKSEKFQQLELKHVPDRGCLPCIEFR